MTMGQKQSRDVARAAKVLLMGGLVAAFPARGMEAAQERAGAVPDAQVEANVLKALASAPELSAQDIQSSTVYGVVRLSGTVQTETLRVQAENLAARATGVKKVVDELTLGTPTQPSGAAGDQAETATAQDGEQAATGGAPEPAEPATPYVGATAQTAGGPGYGAQPGYPAQPVSPGYGRANPGQAPPYGTAESAPAPYGTPAAGNGGSNPTYGSTPGSPYGQPSYPPSNGNYGANGYPQQPGYPAQPASPQQQAPFSSQPGYPGQPAYGYAQPQGGQPAGMPVTVPAGALLRVRINRGLDSNHLQPGTPFDGTMLSDVPAGGLIAIPRGASVQGVVVDAHRAGALKGEGELALQITGLSLGGVVYPVQSDIWSQQGRDKSVRTVNSALGLGVLGAIVGGVAGGGAGAAVGAGVGAGVGVAGSAASPGGQVIVPPEAVLTFHLAQPTQLQTVSEGEMQRLAYSAGPPAYAARPVVRRRVYPYGYGPYGYPYGYRYPY